MRENVSLFWIDWRLAGRMTALQSFGRFVLLFVMAVAFLSFLLSSGSARYITSNYVITALLKESVSGEEATGLTKRIAALSPVRQAEYRDPAASWKEFIRAYPGVESISGVEDNPLPGYIEIRIRHDQFTQEDIRTVTSALKPLEQVDKVLIGEESLREIFKIERALNVFFIGGFALLVALFFVICRLQERIRCAVLAGDFEFLRGRGVMETRIACSRAAGAAVLGGFLAAVAVGVSVVVLNFLVGKYPFLVNVVGPREELFLASTVNAAGVFVLFAAVMFVGASLLGWTPLRPAEDQ